MNVYSDYMNSDGIPTSRRKLLNILSLVFAWIFLAFLIHHLIRGPAGLIANRNLRERLQQTRQSIRNLEISNELLRQSIDYRRSDDYLEELARTELRRIYAGETMILFPTPSRDATATPEASSKSESGTGDATTDTPGNNSS